jgi:Icc protein
MNKLCGAGAGAVALSPTCCGRPVRAPRKCHANATAHSGSDHYRMVMLLLAHLSDLHLGRSQRTDERAVRLCRMLVDRAVDHVVVSGDVTHRGRSRDLARFQTIFAPFLERDRLTVVPGNHDRLGDDVGPALMGPARVAIAHHPGLTLLRLDTTGVHNRSFMAGHGLLTEQDLAAVRRALDQASPRSVVALVMHHHPLPLPHDNTTERWLARLGWASGAELPLGGALTELLRGRCDLVLHGHRHLPSTTGVFAAHAGTPRPLTLCNAGSSTDLGHVRVFMHRGGHLIGTPVWMTGAALGARPFRELEPLAAAGAVGQA